MVYVLCVICLFIVVSVTVCKFPVESDAHVVFRYHHFSAVYMPVLIISVHSSRIHPFLISQLMNSKLTVTSGVSLTCTSPYMSRVSIVGP